MDFVQPQPMPTRVTDDQLRSIGIPVLAIIAGRSVMLSPAQAAANARKLLPHGRIEVWDDASHAINGEYPERVAESTNAFWDGHEHDG